MNTLEAKTNRIAQAIVELVERTNGYVTLARVEREIPGFAKRNPPAWAHVVTHANGTETSFWDNMSKAGLTAFRKVMRERRVAIQFVNVLPYILEDCVCTDENWQPIALLPARAGNLDTPNYLMRAPEWMRERFAWMAAPGHRLLTPGHVSFTADPFFGVESDASRTAG